MRIKSIYVNISINYLVHASLNKVFQSVWSMVKSRSKSGFVNEIQVMTNHYL